MFTGLVEEVGELRDIAPESTGVRLRVQARVVTADCHVGDSIAVNGCCLTVVATTGGDWFAAHAGSETLQCTTVGQWRPGRAVNLERALKVGARLGGHFVQGHVDGVGQILALIPEGETTRWRFRLPPELSIYVVEKGSLAIDGISLTVTAAEEDTCEVAIIPHTAAQTALGTLRPGDSVNLEVDVLAKYVQRMLAAQPGRGGTMTAQFLREHGFA